jgi:hypothetical protein
MGCRSMLGIVVALWVLVSTGCVGVGPLPDPGPLVAATAACHDAAALAGRDLEALVRATPVGDATARRFARAWDARLTVTRAMTDYAQDLRAVIERADAAEARAQALADRLSRLAAAAGFVAPGGSVVPVASASAAMIWGQVARARAAETLAAALAEADAAVRLITAKLAEDQGDLVLLVHLAADAARAEIEDEPDARALASFRDDLRAAGTALIAPGEPAMKSADRARLVELAGLLSATEPTWAALTARLDAVERRRAAALLVVDRLGEAVRAWANAHEAFARAARGGGGEANLDQLHAATRRLADAARAARDQGGHR